MQKENDFCVGESQQRRKISWRRNYCWGRVDGRTSKALKEVLRDLQSAYVINNTLSRGGMYLEIYDQEICQSRDFAPRGPTVGQI